ncbi:hypothetical protein TNCV_2989071 [Trichonephila clavipes]|nr:hypothetical protein TNCV_2989071 [Trichonephila clavipes]
MSCSLRPVRVDWNIYCTSNVDAHKDWFIPQPNFLELKKYSRTSAFKLCRLACGGPVVKVSDHGRHSMSSSPVPLKNRRVGE